MGDSAGFTFYADAAAKSLRLGRGYFIRLPKAATITKKGTPAPTDRPYSLAINSGWNLIGNPFLTSIRWSDVSIQVPGQSSNLTLAQALQQKVLQAGLLTLAGGTQYRDSSTLEPWVGYWVRANRPVTLLIPPPSTTADARPPARLPSWDGKVPPTPAVQ